MNAQDELALLILPMLDGTPNTLGGDKAQAQDIAEALLAAGWRHSIPRCQWRAHHRPDEGDEYCCGQRVVMVPVMDESGYDPSG